MIQKYAFKGVLNISFLHYKSHIHQSSKMFRQVQVTQHTCSALWKSFPAQQFKYRKSLTQKLFTRNLPLEQYLQQHLPILHTGNIMYIVETQKTLTTKWCNKFKQYNYKKCNNKILVSHSCFTYQIKPSELLIGTCRMCHSCSPSCPIFFFSVLMNHVHYI